MFVFQFRERRLGLQINDMWIKLFSKKSGKQQIMTKKKEQKNTKPKAEIILAVITYILAAVVLSFGFLEVFFYKETMKNCTSVVMGSVEKEGTGILYGMKGTVEGRYLNTGKSQKYWIKIDVRTDGVFTRTPLYAGRGYGTEGDLVEIHYNPADPDEYYIGDYLREVSYAAIFLFSVSGIFLAIAVFLTVHINLKKKTQDVKKKKLSAKKDKMTPREKFLKRAEVYRKNYTNERIREQILEDCVLFRFLIVSFLIACFLILLSIGRTIKDIYTDHKVPFNNFYWNINDDFYSVEITEKPQKVYGSYYDLTVGNEHIPARGFDLDALFEKGGPVKLRGKIKRIKDSDENARKSIKEYYQKTGYLESLKEEEYCFYYLDGAKPNMWKELKNNHPLGLVFGLTILVVLIIVNYDDSTLNTAKHIRPAVSGRRRSAKQIDDLANHPDTIWLDDIKVFVTPEALIGLNHGLTVIDYKDIAGIRVKTRNHSRRAHRGPRGRVGLGMAIYYALTEHHTEWQTYRLIIRTKKHRNMLLTETAYKYGYKQLLPVLSERCVDVDIKLLQ